jgi:cytoskeletal protein CcmA (bactofilin family)
MFKQKAAANPGGSNVASPAAPSLLSADLVINGNLTSEGDMQVDGKVEGDILSKQLTISSQAVVRGSVEADTVVVAGEVTGQIKARHVTLTKTAKVIADVLQERLTIEPGAFFEGNCRHFPDDVPIPSAEVMLDPPSKSNGAALPPVTESAAQAKTAVAAE